MGLCFNRQRKLTMKRLLKILALLTLGLFTTGGKRWMPWSPPSGGGGPSFLYAPGWDVSASGGTEQNFTDVDYVSLVKRTFPSAGTVTKLGIYTVYVNSSSTIKLAIFDASRVPVGSVVTGTIASGDGQWHDITSSISIPSAGTYYIGIVMDGPYTGSLVGRQGVSTGDEYASFDSGAYGNFPGSLTGLTNGNAIWALRAEFTP